MPNPQVFSATGQYQLRHILAVIKQDLIGNRSYVKITTQVEKLEGWGYYTSENRPWNIKVDGVTRAQGSTTYDFNNYSTLVLGTWEGWIAHDNDGKKSIDVTSYFSGYSNMGYATSSQTHVLPTIPRGHSFTLPEWFYVGDSVSITITKSVAAYTSRISVWDGDKRITASKTITDSGQQTFTFTPSEVEALYEALSDTDNKQVNFYCETMSGTTRIAVESIYVPAWVRSSVVPTIEQIYDNEANQKVIDLGLNPKVYIAGISEIIVGASGISPGQGSALASEPYRWTLGDLQANVGTHTFPPTSRLSNALRFTVTDKRGRVGTKSRNITQIAYEKPSITTFAAKRYDKDDPTKVNFDLTANATSIQGKNTIQYKIVQQKKTSTTETTMKDWTNLSAESVNLSSSYLGTLPNDGDYWIGVYVRDKFSESVRWITIRSSRRMIFELDQGDDLNFLLASLRRMGHEVFDKRNFFDAWHGQTLDLASGATHGSAPLRVWKNDLTGEVYFDGWINVTAKGVVAYLPSQFRYSRDKFAPTQYPNIYARVATYGEIIIAGSGTLPAGAWISLDNLRYVIATFS